MPESVTDRCTKSHEYIFLLSKSQKYYFDNEAIKEPLAYASILRLSQDVDNQEGSARVPGKTNGPIKAVYKKPVGWSNSDHYKDQHPRYKKRKKFTKDMASGGTNIVAHSGDRKGDGTPFDYALSGMRNKRSVWTVTTKPYIDAHFATFPPELITPCILAGSPVGGVVLDPFIGSGTVAEVSREVGRKYIGIELNPEYIDMAKDRLQQQILL